MSSSLGACLFYSPFYFPSSHREVLGRRECLLLSRVLHFDPVDIPSSILEHLIYIGDPAASKEVLPYGILITKLCEKSGIVCHVNSSIMHPMDPINNSSRSKSKRQTSGSSSSKNKRFRPSKNECGGITVSPQHSSSDSGKVWCLGI